MTASVTLVILICTRFIMVFMPHIGYIHPDEFFQSVEITSGDVLKVDIFRTWEFESSNPIRSIAFPYVMSGLPVCLLKYLQQFTTFTITPYWLLVLPRLWMTSLSLITDLSIYIMCRTFDINYIAAMNLFAASYAALVYMSRTFSNTLETFFVSLFLCILLQYSALWKSRSQKPKKLFLEIKPLTGIPSILLGMIVITGIFNRPTYLAFILSPTLLWLFLIRKKSTTPNLTTPLLITTLWSSLGILLCFFIYVFLDTFYYQPNVLDLFTNQIKSCFKYDFMKNISCFKESLTEFVVTPWNFIRYNTQSANLSSHGLHSRFLHILVNLPILLGPGIILIFWALIKMVLTYMKSAKDINYKVLYLSIVFLCPVLCLSAFPHQEPRFLLPVVPVACVLLSEILGRKSNQRLFWSCWIAFNFTGTIFFGFLHQGAVIPSIFEVQSDLSTSAKGDNLTTHHLIFYKTYMPPRHLLLSNTVNIVDLGGASVHTLVQTVRNINKTTRKNSITIISPSTVFSHLKDSLPQNFKMNFICPHLSMEDPPDLLNIINSLHRIDEHLSDFCINLITIT